MCGLSSDGMPAGSFDLHAFHSSSGQTDLDAFPYIPALWTSEDPQQIPNTFRPASSAAPRGQATQRPTGPRPGSGPAVALTAKKSKKAKILPVIAGLHYCHAFAARHHCANGASVRLVRRRMAVSLTVFTSVRDLI